MFLWQYLQGKVVRLNSLNFLRRVLSKWNDSLMFPLIVTLASIILRWIWHCVCTVVTIILPGLVQAPGATSRLMLQGSSDLFSDLALD